MTVIIRTDSSIEIGTGHIMRCLALADQLRVDGASVAFVCCELPGHLCGLIGDKGYPIHLLPFDLQQTVDSDGLTRSALWLEVDVDEEAAQTVAVFKENQLKPDWLIIDHYALGDRWETQMRPHVGRIMVIDDLANRPHDADLLLDQNFYENAQVRYEGLVPSHCRQLLGPHYALLRSEFSKAREKILERSGNVDRILVFFGGVDATNETTKALEAIRLVGRPDVAVDVVVGSSNPHKAQIETASRGMPNVMLHHQVTNMAQLMVAADLAIGAGGTTSWERCCMGLASLIVAVADNQVAIGQTLGKAGIGRYLGTAQEVSVERLAHEVCELTSEPEAIRAMSQRSVSLVDGQGALRVISKLWALSRQEVRT